MASLTDIANLITALAPLIPITVGTVESALEGAGVDVDADLRALIVEAVAAKSEADLAASGRDPQV